MPSSNLMMVTSICHSSFGRWHGYPLWASLGRHGGAVFAPRPLAPAETTSTAKRPLFRYVARGVRVLGARSGDVHRSQPSPSRLEPRRLPVVSACFADSWIDRQARTESRRVASRGSETATAARSAVPHAAVASYSLARSPEAVLVSRCLREASRGPAGAPIREALQSAGRRSRRAPPLDDAVSVFRPEARRFQLTADHT